MWRLGTAIIGLGTCVMLPPAAHACGGSLQGYFDREPRSPLDYPSDTALVTAIYVGPVNESAPSNAEAVEPTRLNGLEFRVEEWLRGRSDADRIKVQLPEGLPGQLGFLPGQPLLMTLRSAYQVDYAASGFYRLADEGFAFWMCDHSGILVAANGRAVVFSTTEALESVAPPLRFSEVARAGSTIELDDEPPGSTRTAWERMGDHPSSRTDHKGPTQTFSEGVAKIRHALAQGRTRDEAESNR